MGLGCFFKASPYAKLEDYHLRPVNSRSSTLCGLFGERWTKQKQ